MKTKAETGLAQLDVEQEEDLTDQLKSNGPGRVRRIATIISPGRFRQSKSTAEKQSLRDTGVQILH